MIRVVIENVKIGAFLLLYTLKSREIVIKTMCDAYGSEFENCFFLNFVFVLNYVAKRNVARRTHYYYV